MSATAYFDAAAQALRRLAATQLDAIRRAADVWVEAIVNGRRLFSFGASHSFIVTEELVYRSGGLMLINPIYPHGMNFAVHPLPATSAFERLPELGRALLRATAAREGDVLLLTSTSGRNTVIIDMALEAQAMRLRTLAITSLEYSQRVDSRHPSGRKLADLCELVLDNGAPYGDACVAVPGFAQRIGPLSTLGGCAVANALVAETVARLVERGVTPPVFMSANLDGGDAHNARLLAENRARIFYL